MSPQHPSCLIPRHEEVVGPMVESRAGKKGREPKAREEGRSESLQVGLFELPAYYGKEGRTVGAPGNRFSETGCAVLPKTPHPSGITFSVKITNPRTKRSLRVDGSVILGNKGGRVVRCLNLNKREKEQLQQLLVAAPTTSGEQSSSLGRQVRQSSGICISRDSSSKSTSPPRYRQTGERSIRFRGGKGLTKGLSASRIHICFSYPSSMGTMEDTLTTIAQYAELAAGLSESQFTAKVTCPLLIEKIGLFGQGHLSPLSGTVLVHDVMEIPKLDDANLAQAQVFALTKKPGSIGVDIFVGRAPTNDLILPNPSVSKSHAHFTPVPGTDRFHLVDMFSSNGTFLNGNKLHPFEKHPLEDYDEISFGPDYLLIYCSPKAFYHMLKRIKG